MSWSCAPPSTPSTTSARPDGIARPARTTALAPLPSAPAARVSGRPVLRVLDDCADPGLAMEGTFTRAFNLTYARVGGLDLKLDLAWPTEGKGPFPLVVLIHGGGWIAGKRDDMIHELRMLVEQGIAAATIDYRMAVDEEGKFPAAIQDVRCALRFLKAQAGRFPIDAKRVAVAGPSSGGHLAALLAASTKDDPTLDGTFCTHAKQPLSVVGAVAYYAPLDLRPFMGEGVPEDIITTFLGTSPTEQPDRAALASPITHLDPEDPPFMLVHGGLDILVPPLQSRSFKWTLDQLGIPGLYVELPGEGHGFFMFKGEPAFRKATCTMVGFLRQVLGLPPRVAPGPPPEEIPPSPVRGPHGLRHRNGPGRPLPTRTLDDADPGTARTQQDTHSEQKIFIAYFDQSLTNLLYAYII